VANSLAVNLTSEDSEENVENIIDNEPEKGDEDNDTHKSAVFEHCCVAGKIYLHYSTTHFSIFVSRGLNQRC
jgi:hypothetical protein